MHGGRSSVGRWGARHRPAPAGCLPRLSRACRRRAWTTGVWPSLSLAGWRVTPGLSLCMTSIRGGRGRKQPVCVFFLSWPHANTCRPNARPAGRPAGSPLQAPVREEGDATLEGKGAASKPCAPPLSFRDNRSARARLGAARQDHSRVVHRSWAGARHHPPLPTTSLQAQLWPRRVPGACGGGDASAPSKPPFGAEAHLCTPPGTRLPSGTAATADAGVKRGSHAHTHTPWEARPAGEKEREAKGCRRNGFCEEQPRSGF